jgi:hypothetical protein
MDTSCVARGVIAAETEMEMAHYKRYVERYDRYEDLLNQDIVPLIVDRTIDRRARIFGDRCSAN